MSLNVQNFLLIFPYNFKKPDIIVRLTIKINSPLPHPPPPANSTLKRALSNNLSVSYVISRLKLLKRIMLLFLGFFSCLYFELAPKNMWI